MVVGKKSAELMGTESFASSSPTLLFKGRRLDARAFFHRKHLFSATILRTHPSIEFPFSLASTRSTGRLWPQKGQSAEKKNTRGQQMPKQDSIQSRFFFTRCCFPPSSSSSSLSLLEFFQSKKRRRKNAPLFSFCRYSFQRGALPNSSLVPLERGRHASC